MDTSVWMEEIKLKVVDFLSKNQPASQRDICDFLLGKPGDRLFAINPDGKDMILTHNLLKGMLNDGVVHKNDNDLWMLKQSK